MGEATQVCLVGRRVTDLGEKRPNLRLDPGSDVDARLGAIQKRIGDPQFSGNAATICSVAIVPVPMTGPPCLGNQLSFGRFLFSENYVSIWRIWIDTDLRCE